jgi:hypothetical protein
MKRRIFIVPRSTLRSHPIETLSIYRTKRVARGGFRGPFSELEARSWRDRRRGHGMGREHGVPCPYERGPSEFSSSCAQFNEFWAMYRRLIASSR